MVTKQDLETLEERLIGTGNNLQNNQNFLQEQILNVEQLMPVLRNIKRTEWKQIGNTIQGNTSQFGLDIDYSRDGNFYISKDSYFDFNTYSVYEWNSDNNTWEQKGSSIKNNDDYYTKISISSYGDIIVIGDSYDNINSGKVETYMYINNDWEKIETLFGDYEKQYFGNQVKLSYDGTILGIMSYNAISDGLKFVDIYKLKDSKWEKIGERIYDDKIDVNFNNSFFGFNMSFSKDGHIIGISALAYDSTDKNLVENGKIEVYKYNEEENIWEKMGNTIYGENSWDWIGHNGFSLSSDGTILSVNSYFNDDKQNQYDGYYRNTNNGFVKVFNYNGNDWVQMGSTLYGDVRSYFGVSTCLSSDGKKIVIGSLSDTVHYYEYLNNNWVQTTFPIKGENNSHFGERVSISYDGTRILTSSHLSENGGKIYSFELEKIEPGELYYGTDYKLKIMQ